MKCPHCRRTIEDPRVAAGRKGGRARVRKGFAAPDVQQKALATRARKLAAKQGD